ncbi:MAG TPA: amidohydrolase [Mycobacteriales bacterium]|nr:amidohydrolase [Mycobacteriales bacterium]
MNTSPLLASSLAPLLTDERLSGHLDTWLAEHGESLIQIRRHLHAHPDLSGHEQPTASFLAQRLTEAGLRPQFIPARNGLICEFGSGETIIGLRADIDALPLDDVKNVPYRSTVAGACHACGHDAHATIMVGTALALAALGDAFPGRVRLLLQPSEEKAPLGSLDVIEAGGVEGLTEIYALHCDPKVPAGQVGLRVGPITAACDLVTINLKGPGGHTARPHLTADLVGALGRIITEVPPLLGRKVDNRSGLLVAFGAVNAGVAQNVIPEFGSVGGSIRLLDSGVWERIPELFEQTVHEVVAPTGVDVSIVYARGMPPVDNAEHAISVLSGAATKSLGPGAVVPTQQSMGGEDFAWYLRHVPGAMARLGVGRPGESLDIHQPHFDIDERALGYGVRLFATTVVEAMRR